MFQSATLVPRFEGRIGGQDGAVQLAGLTLGFTGLYQVNVTVQSVSSRRQRRGPGAHAGRETQCAGQHLGSLRIAMTKTLHKPSTWIRKRCGVIADLSLDA